MSFSNWVSCRVSGPENEYHHESCHGHAATARRRHPGQYIDDSIIGCRCMIKARFERCDENARGVWVGLLREKCENVLDG